MTLFFCLTTAKATIKMEWSIRSFVGKFEIWGEQTGMSDSVIREGCLALTLQSWRLEMFKKCPFKTLIRILFTFRMKRRKCHIVTKLSGSNVTIKPKNMKELKKDLQDAGVSLPLGKWLKLANLQALAQQQGLEISTKKHSSWLGRKTQGYSTNTLGMQVDWWVQL